MSGAGAGAAAWGLPILLALSAALYVHSRELGCGCLPPRSSLHSGQHSAPAVPSGGRCLEPSLLASRKRSVTSDSLMGKGQFSSRDWLLLFLPGDPCHLVLGLVSRRSRASAPVPAMTPDVPAVALGSSGDWRWGGGSCFTVLSATPCP